MIDLLQSTMSGPAPRNASVPEDLCSLPLPELYQLGKRLQDEADFRAALEVMQEARRRLPQHQAVLLDLIKVHQKLRQDESLRECVHAAWELLPGNPAGLDHLGEELQSINEHSLAFKTFAMLQESSIPEVRAVGRARETALHLRLGRREQASAACADACALCPGIPEVRSAKALLLQETDPEEAVGILAELAQPKAGVPLPFTVACGHRLAVVCDKLGRHDEAIAALNQAKELECRHLPVISQLRAQRREWREWHSGLADFTSVQGREWREQAAARPGPDCAFLLGHPRSGTTLLEQILDAHPRVRSVEETDIFANLVARDLIKEHGELPLAPDFPRFLDQLSSVRLGELRERYLAEMALEAGHPSAGTILLDKNPGLTIVAALIARVAPQARIIVALRDPRDVCLSAFFQANHRNAWSSNWLTLEETVNQYVFTMDLWLQTRDKLAQPWLEVRYEDVISDPVTVGTQVTRFLGLDWHEAQIDPAAHARGKIVRSPTHADVIQPIYQHAAGRWHRYEKHLVPYQETLAPYCRAFGYAD